MKERGGGQESIAGRESKSWQKMVSQVPETGVPESHEQARICSNGRSAQRPN